MSAITDLKLAWQARVDTIADAVIKAEATCLLDQYIAALPQQAALEANQVTSYSIGGRSFTRRTIGEGQAAISRLRQELHRYCYGSTSLCDANADDISGDDD